MYELKIYTPKGSKFKKVLGENSKTVKMFSKDILGKQYDYVVIDTNISIKFTKEEVSKSNTLTELFKDGNKLYINMNIDELFHYEDFILENSGNVIYIIKNKLSSMDMLSRLQFYLIDKLNKGEYICTKDETGIFIVTDIGVSYNMIKLLKSIPELYDFYITNSNIQRIINNINNTNVLF